MDTYKGSRDIEAVKTYINDMLYQRGLGVDSARESEKIKEPPINPDEPVHVQQDMLINFDSDEDAIV